MICPACFRLAAISLVAAACATAYAADSDADALALESDDAVAASAVASPSSKAFAEGGIGWADQRYGLGSRTVGRAALDGRYSSRLTASIQGVVSARLDWSDPPDERIDGAVFSLREAYLGWQDEAAVNLVEAGRVNLRESPGYGYNPTDFFRDNSLRVYSAVDPGTLRDYRMGAVMLRGQHLWSGGSVAAVYAPKLADSRSTDSFSFDWGATNAVDRGQLSLALRPSDKVNTELRLYKEAASDARFGASVTALVSDAMVVFAEGTYSREPALIDRALPASGPLQTQPRFNFGLSYTTATRLSVTAEYHYNGFALDETGLDKLLLAAPTALVAYFSTALALQDNAARDALFLYAVQRDLGVKNLDLTGLLKLNLTDDSRLVWLDLTYRLPKLDLSLRGLGNIGTMGSEFGSAPTKYSLGIVMTAYF
ncbi:MAG: hypothetical protein HXY24_10930 [Rubrivivax sp.]|nr:hypothetical protein [Rubrivivax sp.]